MSISLRSVPVTIAVVAMIVSAPALRADDNGKQAAIAAAAVALGVVAVAHHNSHHKDNDHYDDANRETNYERGYQDGLHDHHFDEDRRGDDYRDGYEAGQYERKHRTAHYREDDDYRNRHDAPTVAQRACVGEAAESWDISPRDIYPVRSKQVGGDDYLVEVAAGYRHGNCEVSGDGRIFLLKDGSI